MFISKWLLLFTRLWKGSCQHVQKKLRVMYWQVLVRMLLEMLYEPVNESLFFSSGCVDRAVERVIQTAPTVLNTASVLWTHFGWHFVWCCVKHCGCCVGWQENDSSGYRSTHREEREALEGWPCNRESFSEFNRLSRTSNIPFSCFLVLGCNRQAQESSR